MFILQYALSGDKLKMIRIGTTDVSPDDVAPTVHNMKVCACQDSPMGNGETKAFHCGATGRYLVVLLEKTEKLVLCEVEVFQGNCYTCKSDYIHYTR